MCARRRFNCDNANPCSPACVEGKEFYPGLDGDTFVHCIGEECSIEQCPARTKWDDDAQMCLHRSTGYQLYINIYIYASGMYAMHNIDNFEALLRKNII